MKGSPWSYYFTKNKALYIIIIKCIQIRPFVSDHFRYCTRRNLITYTTSESNYCMLGQIPLVLGINRNVSPIILRVKNKKRCTESKQQWVLLSLMPNGCVRLFMIWTINKWLTNWESLDTHVQYIPRNMHTVCCALLCCGFAIVHNEFTWSIYPYSSGLLCWHWGNR